MYGTAGGDTGYGVCGDASAREGSARGVFGITQSKDGRAVDGLNAADTGIAMGVRGESTSTDGRGVHGVASSPAGVNYGVYGQATSPTRYALYGQGRLKMTGRSFLATPNSAPSDFNLNNASISFYLDQSHNQLKVRVRYTNGTLKTGSIALI